jgi:hypothetical protein
MRVPTQGQQRCPKCQTRTIAAKLGAKVVVLNADPDPVTEHPRDQYVLTVTSRTYTAGKPTGPNQRAALLAQGHVLHTDHAKTCTPPAAQRDRRR